MDLWLRLMFIYLVCSVLSILVRYTLYQPDNQGQFWRHLVLSVNSFGGAALSAELVSKQLELNLLAGSFVVAACLLFAFMVRRTTIFYYRWKMETKPPSPPENGNNNDLSKST